MWKERVWSGVAIVAIVIWTIMCALVSILAFPFDRKKRPALLMTRMWARFILWVSGVKITLHGLDHIKPHQTYIVVANHQSLFDIPATLGFLPLPLRMLAKKELFRIPIFGWGMWAAGHISLDRGNKEKSLKSVQKAGEKLRRAEASIMIYPEGTRSPDGEIHKFKRGAFFLSTENNLPILPVSIKGSRAVLPKKSLVIRPGHITVTVAAPIMPSFNSETNLHMLKEQTRETIVKLFSETGGVN